MTHNLFSRWGFFEIPPERGASNWWWNSINWKCKSQQKQKAEFGRIDSTHDKVYVKVSSKRKGKASNSSAKPQTVTPKISSFHAIYIPGHRYLSLCGTGYCTHAIITRGLYIFTPFFSAVYNQERLILEAS